MENTEDYSGISACMYGFGGTIYLDRKDWHKQGEEAGGREVRADMW